jgi:epoxyqueuosine reductase QueG
MFDEGKLRDWLKTLEIDLFGFASMTEYDGELYGIDRDLRVSLPYAISIGIRLSKGVLGTVKDGPNLLYYHHYRQINIKLDSIATNIARKLEDHGFLSCAFPASQIVDWKRQLGHISHKKVGSLAGHGWIGRNNLLVNDRYGSQVRYTTILTNMPLSSGKPMGFKCNDCTACLNVCPAGAIHEDPKDFDHIGCYNKITELKNKRNIGQHICGICVEACKGKD